MTRVVPAGAQITIEVQYLIVPTGSGDVQTLSVIAISPITALASGARVTLSFR